MQLSLGPLQIQHPENGQPSKSAGAGLEAGQVSGEYQSHPLPREGKRGKGTIGSTTPASRPIGGCYGTFPISREEVSL